MAVTMLVLRLRSLLDRTTRRSALVRIPEATLKVDAYEVEAEPFLESIDLGLAIGMGVQRGAGSRARLVPWTCRKASTRAPSSAQAALLVPLRAEAVG